MSYLGDTGTYKQHGEYRDLVFILVSFHKLPSELFLLTFTSLLQNQPYHRKRTNAKESWLQATQQKSDIHKAILSTNEALPFFMKLKCFLFLTKTKTRSIKYTKQVNIKSLSVLNKSNSAGCKQKSKA